MVRLYMFVIFNSKIWYFQNLNFPQYQCFFYFAFILVLFFKTQAYDT